MSELRATSPGEAAGDLACHWLLTDAALAQGGRIIAVGDRGVILHSEDNGRSWQRSASEASRLLCSLVFASNGRDGWAGGHEGSLLVTHDAGLSWKTCYKSQDPEAAFLALTLLNDQEILAVGAFGLTLRSHDGGQSWDKAGLPELDRHLNNLRRLHDGRLLLVGESGLVQLSDARGSVWSELRLPYEGSFFRSLEGPQGWLLIHGLRGHIFRCDVSSKASEVSAWQEISSPVPALLAASLLRRNGDLLLAGQARVLLLSHDQGRHFEAAPGAPSTAVSCLLEAADGSLLAFGEAGVSILSTP